MIEISQGDMYAINKYYDVAEGMEDILGDRIQDDSELKIRWEQYKWYKINLLEALAQREVEDNE